MITPALLVGILALQMPGAEGPKEAPTTAAKPKGGCCENGVAKPWAGYDKGVAWCQYKDPWEEAKRDHKLVLFFELVGDLDKEGC